MVLQVTCVFVSSIHAVILSCSVDADQCVGGVATIIFLIFHLFIFCSICSSSLISQGDATAVGSTYLIWHRFYTSRPSLTQASHSSRLGKANRSTLTCVSLRLDSVCWSTETAKRGLKTNRSCFCTSVYFLTSYDYISHFCIIIIIISDLHAHCSAKAPVH